MEETWTLIMYKNGEPGFVNLFLYCFGKGGTDEGKGERQKEVQRTLFHRTKGVEGEMAISVKQRGMAILKLHSLKNDSKEENEVHSVHKWVWERKEDYLKRGIWEWSRRGSNT